MEDKSIIKNTDTIDTNVTFINDCIKEVCLKGDSLVKYKRLIEKQYGSDSYQKCINFVKEVRLVINRKKFTQTSIANLNYLANEINVTSATVEALIDYYTKKFANDEKEEKKAVRKSQKGEKEEKSIEEETALMKKVAWAEQKRLEIEIEEKKKKEEEKKRKAKEYRKKAKERRRQKELEEDNIRKEEENQREMEKMQRELEEESIKRWIKWIGIIIALIVWLSIPETGWIFAAIILGFTYYLISIRD